MTYPLAAQGVYRTIQGEGYLTGTPMVFVRLGGCSVGCAECDTDYTVRRRVSAKEIADRAIEFGPCEWVWITGGEPTDHDLAPLAIELTDRGFRVAIATAGVRRVPGAWYDFLAVSPHEKPDRLMAKSGHQINLVHGLNGLRLADWMDFDDSGFTHRYVTPCYDHAEALAECEAFVAARPGWKLGVQQQKVWGLP